MKLEGTGEHVWAEEMGIVPPCPGRQVPTGHSWCRGRRIAGVRSTRGRSRTQSKEDAGTCVWKLFTCPENNGLEGSGRSGAHSSIPRHPAFLSSSLSFKHGARSATQTAESALRSISTEPARMKHRCRSELRNTNCAILVTMCCGLNALMKVKEAFLGGSGGKESAPKARDPGSIPRLGRSLGGGNGNSLQDSCLGNPMNREAWWATVHGVTEESDKTEQLNNKLLLPHCPWIYKPSSLWFCRTRSLRC